MRNSTVTSGAIVTSNAIRGSAKGAAAKLFVRRTLRFRRIIGTCLKRVC
jgi:hypothetical protein